MSSFEPWRLQELALLLEDLVAALRAGKSPEWAGVFGHFGHELERLGPAQTENRGEFSRLIRNIQLCLSGRNGISRLVLEGINGEESGNLNRRFLHLKARLLKSLDEIQKKLVEYVH